MGIGDWFNENILGSTNKAKADVLTPDAESYEYGGRMGGADEAANRYMQQAEDAQGRQAAQSKFAAANYTQADFDRQRGLQARGVQAQATNAMLARALGKTPSISQMQADRQMGQATAAQASAAASARGPAGIALAQQGAANNTANAHSAISNQAQINAANERLQAEQAAVQAGGAMRMGDAGAEGMAGQRSQFDAQSRNQSNQYNATNQMQQRELNDRYDLAKSQMEIGVRGMQMSGAQNREAQTAGNYYNAAGINAGVGGQNAGMAQQTGLGIIGMGGQLAGSIATDLGGGSVTGKADGGPVESGQPYLVGERGPELIVPKKDAVVIPAPQTEGLLSRAMGSDRAAMRDGASDQRTYNFDKSFHRDTPQDQARVKRQVQDQASREADAMMAGYMAALKQGPAAGPTAEMDLDRDAPAPWLAQYMDQQSPQPVAARADGGPLGQGQPAMVGERGPELVVPQMATWGAGTSVEGVGERTRDQYANEAARVSNEANQAAKQESPWERDVRRHSALRAMGDREGAAMVAPGAQRSRAVLRGAKQSQGSAPEAEAKEDPAEKQAVSEGKKAPPTLRSRLGGAVGGVSDGATKLANAVDTRYHGPTGGFSGPQLIPVMAPPRAMGGPMMGGSPYTVGEKGPEMVVPMGGMSMSQPGGPTQLSGGGMDVLGSLKAHSNFATKFQSDPTGGMVAREEGGPVAKGQTALVGEKGPEMVVPQPSLLSRLGDSLRNAVGMQPQTTTAPREPRYAEVSSGAPATGRALSVVRSDTGPKGHQEMEKQTRTQKEDIRLRDEDDEAARRRRQERAK